MKAFLILEDGNVFTGTSIGSTREVISEIVFNTSMTGYLEVLTDPSYAGQAVVMTYPLIGNYGITPDMESKKPWPDGYIVRELSRMPSNFRCEGTIQDFLTKNDIPGIAGIDTRALTKILREKGTMNGMITTNENYNIEEIIPKLKAYTTGNVVDKVTCEEKRVLSGAGKRVALMDFGAKNNIAQSLNNRGCEVIIYPAHTTAEEILSTNPDGIMLSNGPGDPKECTDIIKEIKKRFGNAVYTTDEHENLEDVVVRLLKKYDLTVTTAESCTGGLIAGRIVNVPGASEVFNEGYVTYSNKAKKKILGVSKATLKKYGAVSEQTAREMAAGGVFTTDADACIAVTGIAGPDGGTEEKPVGLVYIACYMKDKVKVEEYHFRGNREKVREQTVIQALDLLRRSIIKNYKKD